MNKYEYPSEEQGRLLKDYTRYDGIIRDTIDLWLKNYDKWGIWAD